MMEPVEHDPYRFQCIDLDLDDAKALANEIIKNRKTDGGGGARKQSAFANI